MCADLGGCLACSERDLLSRWKDLVIESDPDLIIGYNILNFDLPYLWQRAVVGPVGNASCMALEFLGDSAHYGLRASWSVTFGGTSMVVAKS